MVAVVAVILLLTAVLLLYIFTAGPKLPAEVEAIIDQVVQSEPPELVQGDTGVASSKGIDIWYERLAPAGASRGVVLLLMGQAGDALMWPPAFVQMFVAAGYQVVRYDYRGTGQSDWMAEWTRRDPYTLADMAADGVCVLETLSVPAAHLVGLSMGGMIAQEIAIAYPNRVLSLTLMSTSGYIGDPELPGLTTGALARSVWRGLPLLKYRLLGGEQNLIRERGWSSFSPSRQFPAPPEKSFGQRGGVSEPESRAYPRVLTGRQTGLWVGRQRSVRRLWCHRLVVNRSYGRLSRPSTCGR